MVNSMKQINTKKTLSRILLTGLLVFSPFIMALELDATLNWAPYKRYSFVVNGIVSDPVAAVGSKVGKGKLLAKLDRQPYRYRLKEYQSAVNKFKPLIIDAKLELDHANELFERTVLSEVELQKIAGKYNALLAEQAIEKARLQLAQWELNHARLIATEEAYVISSNIFPGMVISDENKSTTYFQLASSQHASALVRLSAEQRMQLNSSKLSLPDGKVNVHIDGSVIEGYIGSIAMTPEADNHYPLVVLFKYSKMIHPGRKIKVIF